MTTYFMIEASSLSSQRKSEPLTSTALTAAKREASRKQSFQQTTLRIVNEYGVTLAAKAWKASWSTREDWQVLEESARACLDNA